MTTQIEEIEWHKYPDEKPPDDMQYLVQVNRPYCEMFTLEVSEMYNWDIEQESKIIAWAVMPNGWIKE